MNFRLLLLILTLVSGNFLNNEDISISTPNISMILGDILNGYDNKILPSLEGKPISVRVGVYISDMVPIEKLNMHYSMDVYFRQYWRDYRLTFNTSTIQTIALDGRFAERIWKPDLYFPLVKRGKVAKITRPNEMLRLDSEGNIFFSQRLHLTAFCEMDLFHFPFDQQKCDFVIESYSYSDFHMTLDWVEGGNPIIPPMFKNMLEFTFDSLTYDKISVHYGYNEVFDKLRIHFKFTRNINYYLLQMYLPCILIVFLSWVGFWIDYRSTPARVALGITTVLTMITLSNSIRNSLPFVNYSKLIDIYLLVCFVYVFMGLVEFAIVGITDQKWKKKFEKLTNNILGGVKRKDNNYQQDDDIKNRRISSTLSAMSMNSILEENDDYLNDSVFSENVTPREFNELTTPTDFDNINSTSSTKDLDNSLNNGTIQNGDSTTTVENSSDRTPSNSTINGTTNGLQHRTNRTWKTAAANTTIAPTGDDLEVLKKVHKESQKKRRRLSSIYTTTKKMNEYLFEKQKKDREIHIIDKMARYVYPFTFLIFNIIYFLYAYIHWRTKR